MANEYIISKWRLWFRAMDVNHRGTITRSDVKQEDETFVRLCHLGYEEGKEFQAKHDNIWEEIIFREKSGSINEQEFVDMNIRDYTENKERFAEGMRKAYTTLADLLDVNREGCICKQEFVNLLKASGHDNDALNEKFFNDYNPVDGKITSRAVVDSWVQFTSSDDSSKGDIVKEALEAEV